MAKLKLSSVTLNQLRKQVVEKGGASSSRVVKNALHVRGKKMERRIEKAYAQALNDMVSTLATKTRLPSSPSVSGPKSVSVKPYGSATRVSALTPYYVKLSPRTLEMHKKQGSGTKVFWHESGWYAKRMANRVGRASKDWSMRQVQFSGKLGLRGKMKMRAKIQAPSFYSNTLNKIIMEPFFNPNMGDVDVPSTSLSVANNVVGRTAFLESRRPLLSVIMRKHGREAWKYLKADVL